ncbi:MAG TPA: hypothetical protein VJN21_15020 [Candidatus Acidoferrales bacterium]|nr:hypothetical protein [Candidatus Acidoferrales bacterium]
MDSRSKTPTFLIALGCVVLLASSALHCLAYTKVAPALGASNLAPKLQSALRVAFLSMAWNWLILAIIAWLAAFRGARLRKPIVLLCGFAVLLQALFTVAVLGFFIGNEMIGVASLLILCGGFLLPPSPA